MTFTVRFVANVIALTTVYALVLASLHPADLLAGAVMSGLLILAVDTGVHRIAKAGDPSLFHRLIWSLPFALKTIWLIVTGAWNVALMVVHVRPIARVGFVEVPIGDRSVAGIVASAFADTLSPGSVFIDVDWERDVMIFHVLGSETPDEIRAEYEAFYRRYQRHVVP